MRCHDDDHLSLVAGISKLQINDLKARGIGTIKGVADTNARSATGDDGSRSRRGAAG
jgi:predicted RecB family nuclease